MRFETNFDDIFFLIITIWGAPFGERLQRGKSLGACGSDAGAGKIPLRNMVYVLFGFGSKSSRSVARDMCVLN